jgi:iron complex transport system substrate-binding protein
MTLTGTLKWLLLGLAAPSLLVAAAACGGDDDNGDDTTPVATAEPTGSAEASPTAGASFEETTYPVELTDMVGRTVTIDAEPAAIAAISPTTVEFVYAVGESSLTRTSSVRFPEAALSATDIGSAYQPNTELLAGASPDLIIADSVLQPQLAGQLEALGVPVLYIGAAKFEDVATAYRLIGRALNTGEGETQAAALEAQLADIEAQLPAEQAKVVILNGTPDDFFVALPESYVGDLARLAGADNLAAGQPSNAPFPGYAKLSLETIIGEAPEVVLAITAAPGQTISEALAGDAAWASVPAVANDRVHEIDSVIFLQAPGPRAGEGLAKIAALLYPDVFN